MLGSFRNFGMRTESAFSCPTCWSPMKPNQHSYMFYEKKLSLWWPQMDPGPNFRDFSAVSCFPSFGGSQGDRRNLGWRITSGALIPQKQYSAWWFQKYVRLLILDFKISEAGNWKNWKIDFKNWMHPKIKQKLPNIAILGIMAPTDSSFLGLKAVGSCRRWVGTACQELGDLRCGWEILVAKHRGYW